VSPIPYTTPRTWVSGEYPTAAQLNQDIRDNQLAAFPLGIGGAWTSYTPTLTQLGAVTKTVTYAKYQRVGRLIVAEMLLAVTGTGTAANIVTVSLPVTAAQAGNIAVGSGYIYDVSAALTYKGIVVLNSTTTATMFPTNTTTGGALGADTFTAGLAAGDAVTLNVTYEAAS
jgi:hypothetical protein